MSTLAELPNAAVPKSSASANGTGQTVANGTGQTVANTDEVRLRSEAAQRSAAAFGGIVAVMMHSPAFQGYTLADLKWLVLPAVLTGQFSLAQARSKETGDVKPVGVVLWASVSDEVDRRLMDESQAAIRIEPDQWRSGPHLWIVEGIGERGIITNQIRRLRERDWRGHPIKIKVRAADGTPVVRQLPPV